MQSIKGVLIPNMELPKDCWDCPCHNGEDGICKLLLMVTDTVPKDCPLEETDIYV